MAETYESQLKLIVRRAQDIGLDRAEINRVYSAKHNELRAEYPDRSDAWRLSRVEWHIWDKLFPRDPNPIKLVRLEATAASTLPFLPAPPPLPPSGPKRTSPYLDLGKREWVHDKFDPGPPSFSSVQTTSPPRGSSRPRDVAVAHISTDRYQGEAYPKGKPLTEVIRPLPSVLVQGDSYRPRLEAPQPKSKTPSPVKSGLSATDLPPPGLKARRELSQAEIAVYDAQNPIRLSRSEGLAGLGTSKAENEAQVQTDIPCTRAKAWQRLTHEEIAAYDAQNPTLLSSNSGNEKPTDPAKPKKENEALGSISMCKLKRDISSPTTAHNNAVAKGRRIFVGNLSYTTTEGELTSLFRRYSIESISMPKDRGRDRPAGYAFVELSTPNEAERAIAELSNKKIHDRKLTFQLAKLDPTPSNIARGSRLYVAPIASKTTKGDLSTFFKRYSIESITIHRNSGIHRPDGYAIVDLSTSSEAKLAIAELSNKKIHDRMVTVSYFCKPSLASNKRGSAASSNPDRPDPYYAAQEGVMELRAIKDNFRRNFFAFLQKARGLVRDTHPFCSRPIRSYLAEKLTWTHFFRDPFPGIEPRKGHSDACLARHRVPTTKGHSCSQRGQCAPAPGLDSVGCSGKPIASPAVKAEPAINSPTQVARRVAAAHGTHDHALSSDRDSVMTDVVATSASQSSAIFKDPEQCWKVYKETLNIPDSSFTSHEQEVKAQGNLRLVMDEDSGQMVSVEELVKRTKYRFALRVKREGVGAENAENVPMNKRKSDEEGPDEERAQKKMRNFLDSFERGDVK